MKSKAFGGVAAACLLMAAGLAHAEEKPGSVYVQCDGKPEIQSLGKTSAQLLGIMLTAGIVGGIVGGPEMADSGKLLEGDKGADACEAALALNKNEARGVQLKLAKAIHEVETAKYDAALADATGLAAVAPTFSKEPAFDHGLGLSAMEIQAAILARQGKAADAEALALKMAAAVPYDLMTTLRAMPYVGLTPEMTPAKRAFFEQASRIWSPSLLKRATADEWAGDFAASARHTGDYIDTIHGFLTDPTLPASSLMLARQSVATLLAGDLAGSNALIEKAKAAIEKQLGEANMVQAATQAQEFVDLQGVARQFAEGHVAEARAAFSARSRWLAPSPAMVAEIATRLRAGAPAAQLTGALAQDPAKLRADGMTKALEAATSAKPVGAPLFKSIRMQGANPFGGLAGQVWRTEKSSLVVPRRPNSTYVGEGLVLTYFNDGEAANKALMLHAALRAKADGKGGFILGPVRDQVRVVVVRYGNPGDTDFPKSSTFEAQKVIDDLSVDIPDPHAKH